MRVERSTEAVGRQLHVALWSAGLMALALAGAFQIRPSPSTELGTSFDSLASLRVRTIGQERPGHTVDMEECIHGGTSGPGKSPTLSGHGVNASGGSGLSQAGHPLGGRLWTHIDRPDRHRLKFRMYQFNPAGSDGKGTGWYHEGDFTEWLTEMLHYEIQGDELVLSFDLARERAQVRYRVEKGKGPDGEDLKLTFLPDPRRYWKPYEYFAHSKPGRVAEPIEIFSKLGP